MGTAAKKRHTNKIAIKPIGRDFEQMAKKLQAKQLFLISTFNLGWRLAITVVIPIVAGVKVDEKLVTSPLFTLIGMVIAAVASSLVVLKTVEEVNAKQLAEEKLNGNLNHA